MNKLLIYILLIIMLSPLLSNAQGSISAKDKALMEQMSSYFKNARPIRTEQDCVENCKMMMRSQYDTPAKEREFIKNYPVYQEKSANKKTNSKKGLEVKKKEAFKKFKKGLTKDCENICGQDFPKIKQAYKDQVKESGQNVNRRQPRRRSRR